MIALNNFLRGEIKMEFRKFKEKYIIRLNKGDEVISSITDLCRKENIKLGSFVGLGAASKATIGLYDTENKLYHSEDT